MAKTSSVIVAGLAGLAAGIALGILFAPDKGSRVRKKLRRKLTEAAENLASEVEGRFNEAKDFMSKEHGKHTETGKEPLT